MLVPGIYRVQANKTHDLVLVDGLLHRIGLHTHTNLSIGQLF